MKISPKALRKLRTVVKTALLSLPTDARKILKGCQVQLGDLGYNNDGEKLQGLAAKRGDHVVLDRAMVEDGPESVSEEVLLHELGHIYRTRTGQHQQDDGEEEKGNATLLKRWGVREARRNVR
ncbi:MAG TPA: hypothetical protein VMG10_27435 [Gemmataceae bacterium]|nr:hypothetical protein [Gemmataceae bacterium]